MPTDLGDRNKGPEQQELIHRPKQLPISTRGIFEVFDTMAIVGIRSDSIGKLYQL